jgi:hypothetical protein
MIMVMVAQVSSHLSDGHHRDGIACKLDKNFRNRECVQVADYKLCVRINESVNANQGNPESGPIPSPTSALSGPDRTHHHTEGSPTRSSCFN